ncbi:hypothetical protein G6L37_35120 [Agrobacterium rubi]|nr:hypothetical protein [Agrobacterium rubi]NTF23802.1 hypothetical protein [Agrobacterium rubi]
MKLAILSHAPSYPAKARKEIKARWPDVDLDLVPVITFYGYSWDGRLFDIPRDIPWQDLPLRRPVARRKTTQLSLRTGIESQPHTDADIETARSVVMTADEVLLLCDDDFETIGGANDLLCDLFGAIPKERVVFPASLFGRKALDGADRETIMLEAGFFENTAGQMALACETSDYFDYNYVLNATPILGLAARNAGLKGTAPSAFGLQLLYWLAENDGASTASDLRSVMAGWRGLGKYADAKGMGSMRSRQAIVERLVSGGYLARGLREKNDDVYLTDSGRRFISLLHKDCRDPDLPFRIRQWQMLPAVRARSRIDGYFNAFFGKQVRLAGAGRQGLWSR